MYFRKISLAWLALFFIVVSALEFFTVTPKQQQFYKREIGHWLFFDKHVSLNHSKSCASCHDPTFAFTDGYRKSMTALGDELPNNAPGILNCTHLHFFDWAKPHITGLTQQLQRPLFNEHPIELGLNQHWSEFSKYFMQHEQYSSLFAKAYSSKKELDMQVITECLVQYEKSLCSFNASFDKFRKGHQNALSLEEREGWQLFQSKQTRCSSCHGGLLFTNASISKNPDSVYFPDSNHIAYKVPGLRNVAVTSPYFHDGSVDDLSTAVEHHIRNLNATNSANILVSPSEKKKLIAFLHSLTDTTYLSNPFFTNPFSLIP